MTNRRATGETIWPEAVTCLIVHVRSGKTPKFTSLRGRMVQLAVINVSTAHQRVDVHSRQAVFKNSQVRLYVSKVSFIYCSLSSHPIVTINLRVIRYQAAGKVKTSAINDSFETVSFSTYCHSQRARTLDTPGVYAEDGNSIG